MSGVENHTQEHIREKKKKGERELLPQLEGITGSLIHSETKATLCL